MKKAQFFQGLSWLLLLNILIKPVWIFLIDREVQNAVGNENYGSYFALFNLSYVLLFIADAGLTNMMVQQLASRASSNTKQLLKIKVLLLFTYAFSCCLVGWITSITQWQLFVYLILIQAASSLLLFLRGLLTANQLYKTDAYFSVADKTLMVLLCSPFIYGWWKPVSLVIFLQLQLASVGIVLLFLFYILLRKKFLAAGYAEKTSKTLQRIFPFAVIILLMGMHYRLDGFLLERIMPDGARQAGVYAAAYRLLDAGNMLGYLVASFLVSFVARNKENSSVIKEIAILLQHILMSIGLMTICFAFVYASWIQQTLYHTSIEFNSAVIQLCLAALPACYLTHIYGSVLTATNNRKTFISILATSVLLNFTLNSLLIPSKGALGACIAALVSQYSCAVACYYAVTKNWAFNRQIKTWMLYAIGAVLFFILLSFLQSVIHSVWIILAVLCLLMIVIALSQRNRVKKLLQSFSH
ncbi:MAG: hypothetical protein EOO10_11955 [Chitinophagaceae bacterium]|nr:MAG: hypothetical protein EOO10_11955 [Chitinophagaceae bacterium]